MQSTLPENLGIQVIQSKSSKNTIETEIIASSSLSVSVDTIEQEESIETTNILKKKRKRNRKKNKTNQIEPKVENLISKTFQAKILAENLNKLNNIEISSINMSSLQNKDTKNCINKTQSVKKAVSPKKISITSANSSSSVKSDGSPTTKSREKILAEREAKKIDKQLNKNKIQTASVPTVTEVSIKNETPKKVPVEKSREEILAEREAKKLAKQSNKNLNIPKGFIDFINEKIEQVIITEKPQKLPFNKTREEILAEREAKKIKKGKQLMKNENLDEKLIETVKEKLSLQTNENMDEIQKIEQKKVLTKAERRAVQEEQRAAKAKLLTDKQGPKKAVNIQQTKTASGTNEKFPSDTKAATKKIEKTTNISINECKVKLFNHLDGNFKEKNLFVNNHQIHPSMVRLGEQFAKRTVVGSNARCIAFLNALKTVIQDYETPPKKEFSRGLESSIKYCVDHLHQCRPLAVSISNAHKCIKFVLTQLPTDQPESELKEHLCEFIETYIKDQIEKAALAISSSVQEKISNGDVILTFGCSSLINHILEEAHIRKIDFRVVVVDSRPFSEGQELLRRLVTKEIPCTYVLINAVGFIMPEVTKVLLGAHALLANGYVMARTGTAQVALVARSFNVPVLVCCETHKFSERVQTDAIVYNELGNPDDLILSKDCKLSNWKSLNHKFSPLNLNFDITPPELVTAVVTEVAILPCTSVPVILRLKPTEIGY